MPQPQRAEKPARHGSTFLAAALVLGAGAIAWFAYQPASPGQAGPMDPAASITLAAASSLGETADEESSGLPTRVRVEAAGIDTSIQEVGVVRERGSASWETAWKAAGHHINSSLPGNPGNVILTGHVSVANQANLPVFANLERVEPGDIVEVFSGSRVHRYEVTDKLEVDPAALEVLEADHRSLVTLITCTRDLERRLVVIGRLLA
jgi:LPXTG-site transpeptidase (sortase) family protein